MRAASVEARAAEWKLGNVCPVCGACAAQEARADVRRLPSEDTYHRSEITGAEILMGCGARLKTGKDGNLRGWLSPGNWEWTWLPGRLP